MVFSTYPPLHTLPDSLLLEMARKGAPGAFETLWARHEGALRRQAWNAARNPQVVEDLLADVRVKALASLDGLQCRGSFGPWAARVLANAWIDRYRKQARQALVPDPRPEEDPGEAPDYFERLPDPAPGPCEEILSQEVRQAIRASVDRLRETHPGLAEAVEFHVFQELPFVELPGPAGTWRSRCHRGLRWLRRDLEVHDPELFDVGR
jgi:RNA polymerase sigma-70 factor, ECF subfamily